MGEGEEMETLLHFEAVFVQIYRLHLGNKSCYCRIDLCDPSLQASSKSSNLNLGQLDDSLLSAVFCPECAFNYLTCYILKGYVRRKVTTSLS